MVEEKLKKYKKKYYINTVLRGAILASISLLLTWLIAGTTEYFGRLGTWGRAGIFYLFLILSLFVLCIWIIKPLIKLLDTRKQLSNLQAAKNIGNYFPGIRDKLLNTLQLKQSYGSTELIDAAINQNTNDFNQTDFSQAVSYAYNKQYLKYLVAVFGLLVVCIIWIPELLTESTTRIIYYERKFEPEAPFSFEVQNSQLQSFKYEDFLLKLRINGSAIPDKVYLITPDNRKLKMASVQGVGQFEYLFKNIQRDLDFHFESLGFSSQNYRINTLPRPVMKGFTAFVNYPDYTGKTDEYLDNIGNLIIPEGTLISWNINTLAADSVKMFFAEKNEVFNASAQSEKSFSFSKKIHQSQTYQIQLINQYSKNKDVIEHYLEVIPDQYPSIDMKHYEDTVLYSYIALAGNIDDDYGIAALKLYYKNIEKTNPQNPRYQHIDLSFDKKVTNQSFFYRLDLDSLLLKQGRAIEYFIEVTDNDQVNGTKSARTPIMKFRLPNKKDIKETLAKDSQTTQGQLNKAIDKAEKLHEDLEHLRKRLKGKKKADWKDKKAIEELLKKKQELANEVDKLQHLQQQLNEKQSKFNDINLETLEKTKKLQELINEVLDEETQSLYDELEKLLEENINTDQLQNLLKNIDLKQENIEHELDRALEFFEKLRFDMKAKGIVKDLQELSEKQEEIAEKTAKNQDRPDEDAENKSGQSDKQKNNTDKKSSQGNRKEIDEIEDQQKAINKEFKAIEKDFKELKELNENSKAGQDLKRFDQSTEEIKQSQQESLEQLRKYDQKNASRSQKRSVQKMRQMAEKMTQMQQSQEVVQLMENYDDLRQILDNLMTLSFAQEDLMKSFKEVRRIDPKFIELSQRQLKLKDDAQLVKDSLLALSRRVFQLQATITKEVNLMNKYIEESLEAIRKRVPYIASGKQQFSMTSVNNLALLLSDVLQQMQSQMSLSMGGQQMNQKQKGLPQLSDLQEQLNRQISQIKKSGKSGAEISKELAKLAAQQEIIRNDLRNAQQGQGKEIFGEQSKRKLNGKENKEGKYADILRKMEQTEEDLINKRITQQTLLRQKEILTRLLESEKASRERELDEEREAKTAQQDYKKVNPDAFSEYLKLKEVQLELLKTLPISLSPYYKKEVNEYFEVIKNNYLTKRRR